MSVQDDRLAEVLRITNDKLTEVILLLKKLSVEPGGGDSKALEELKHNIATQQQSVRVAQQIGKILMSQLDDILQRVTDQKTIVGSVSEFIAGLKQQLLDAQASADPAKLQAVIDGLDADNAALAAAITSNTPAAKIK